ncbi:DNA-directed RNA polymerase V subunit 1-like, partial [Olea europaea var. sylvestris]|uniref:DNA-directed RNA polymerase V subunit 1-like n=1 Tax=Olea europaea var. sylvestris TaxID=158386 RepID=UPI000C1CEB3D
YQASRDVDTRFGVNKEINASSTKAWLEKMKTLFIRKGSGFSSRSVITGDSFKGVSEIGLPFEIAQKITFEERVNQHNMEYLQRLVDEKLCLTYRDGQSTYSLREGSKGHTFLKPGQIVHRRIMDGDIVFINRPPTTHKHSLQALSVYIHDDHTVKINPLICGPLSADFDGDCIHLFYPQSLEAKAEVVELFSVEKQLLSSHTGNFNLQLGTDSLLSLKLLVQNYYLNRAAAQQLAMFASNSLPGPAVLKSCKAGPLWTSAQILQITLPCNFDCSGERHSIFKSEVLRVESNRDVMQSIVNDIVTSIFFLKGPKEVLRFFNTLQPQLMENLYSEGFSVSLRDLFIPGDILKNIQADIQKISPLLHHLRACYSESIVLQLENYLRSMKCSWGKHASVGTGSPFEILWDTRKAELNQQNGLNVYDFLHLVSSSSNQENMGTSCLGVEIDYLDQEDEYMEFDLSPVRDSGIEKPTFEDGDNFAPDENEWVQTSSITDKSSGNWEQVKKAEIPTCSGWGIEKDGKDDNLGGNWGQVVEKVKSATPSGWGIDKSEKDDTFSEKEPEDFPKNDRSAWEKKVDSVDKGPTEKAEQSTWASANASKSSGQSSWGHVVEKVQSSTPGWGVDKGEKDDTVSEKAPEDSPKISRSAWGKKVDSVDKGPKEQAEQSTWASAIASKSSGQSYWGKDVCREDSFPTQTQEYQSVSFSAWGKKQDSEGKVWREKDDQNTTPIQKGHSNLGRSSGEKDWGGKDDRSTLVNTGTPKSSSQSGWNRESDETVWNKKKDRSGWTIPGTAKDNNQSSWGQDAAQTEDVIPAKAQEGSKQATDWDALGSDSGQDGSSSWSSWGKKIVKSDETVKKSDRLISSADGDSIDVLPSNENLWEAKVADHGSLSKPFTAWGSSNDWGKVDSQSPSEQKKDSPVSNGNPNPKESNDSGFAPRRHFAGRGDSNRGRGRGRPGGDWKNNRGRGRSSGRGDFSDDFNALGTFTVTRQRMDLFTAEEQDILSDVEAIMKNIRRIMNQTGYNDGDPISGDDQSYMVDNVLNYHPDKAAKVGVGLKYIMVSRHQEFQDSRCFYAVSIDGAKQDFSYRKCVENFLKEKYPDKAEAFVPKYYRRQQARTGWNKDRGSASGEARTPGWKRDHTPAADEAGTPGWSQDRTPAAEESGTEGWNTGRSTPAQDEAGTRGWNTGCSPPARDEPGTGGWNIGRSSLAQDEAGTPGWNTASTRAREEAGASGWDKSGSR